MLRIVALLSAMGFGTPRKSRTLDINTRSAASIARSVPVLMVISACVSASAGASLMPVIHTRLTSNGAYVLMQIKDLGAITPL